MATKKTHKKKVTSGKKAAKKRTGPKIKASKKLASSPRARSKVRKVMREFKEGKLHSRSEKGPTVRSRKQAIAIALSEAGAATASSKKSRKSVTKKTKR